MNTPGDNNKNKTAHNFENYVPTVAFTLGDTQTVRSTYIAHDPFFFMDVDEATLEEELLNELEGSYGHYEVIEDEARDSNFLDILINFDENLDVLQGETECPSISFEEIRDMLLSSRFASALLEFADSNHIEFIECPHISGVEYNRCENVILFQPILTRMELLRGTICALREAWQNYQGALLQPVALYPDHAVFIHRAQKADLATALLRTAWELDLAGHHDLWMELENGSMRDFTHAFGREASTDFRSLNNGRAAFSVFETWFLSDRSRNADNKLIQKLLSDYTGHQFEDEDMSQLVVVDLVKALGEMPYGKNYLAGHIPNLLIDPIFNEVRERSTANFLWFIKFEKTFSEVEQSLQNESAPSRGSSDLRGELSQTLYSKGSKENGELSAQTGILIPFPERRRGQENGSEKTERVANKGGEVIPFDIAVRPFNGNFFS